MLPPPRLPLASAVSRRRFLTGSGLLAGSLLLTPRSLQAQGESGIAELDARLFPGFTAQRPQVNGVGIRSAIGATREQILGLVLRQGLVRSSLGVAIGLVGAFLLSRTMTSLLFDVSPTDPIVYLAVSIVLIAVALLASYLPARRAARIDPLVALRDE